MTETLSETGGSPPGLPAVFDVPPDLLEGVIKRCLNVDEKYRGRSVVDYRFDLDNLTTDLDFEADPEADSLETAFVGHVAEVIREIRSVREVDRLILMPRMINFAKALSKDTKVPASLSRYPDDSWPRGRIYPFPKKGSSNLIVSDLMRTGTEVLKVVDALRQNKVYDIAVLSLFATVDAQANLRKTPRPVPLMTMTGEDPDKLALDKRLAEKLAGSNEGGVS